MKKTLLLFLILLLAGLLSLQGSATEQRYHWYIKRAKDHAHPDIDSRYTALIGKDAFYLNPAFSPSAEEKVLYLTFDVGYENGNVAKILDVLKKENITGAFFILSHVVKSEPTLLSRMAEEGHLICNHTAHHKDMSSFSSSEFAEELRTLETLYEKSTGKALARFYRPPEGKFSPSNLKTAASMGYKTVFWSLAYCDWDDKIAPSREKAIQILKDNTHNGAIVLLHPTSNINVSIMQEMIDYWKSEGYRFGSLEELGR